MADVNTLRVLHQRGSDGPWRVAEEIDGYYAGHNTVVRAVDGKRVVTVGQTRPHHRTEENEANVHLIVEAVNALPHLLNQLEAVQELINRARQISSSDRHVVYLRDLEEAMGLIELDEPPHKLGQDDA